MMITRKTLRMNNERFLGSWLVTGVFALCLCLPIERLALLAADTQMIIDRVGW